jgi:hypothetical protein
MNIRMVNEPPIDRASHGIPNGAPQNDSPTMTAVLILRRRAAFFNDCSIDMALASVKKIMMIFK